MDGFYAITHLPSLPFVGGEGGKDLSERLLFSCCLLRNLSNILPEKAFTAPLVFECTRIRGMSVFQIHSFLSGS